jgi:hypothetical protein
VKNFSTASLFLCCFNAANVASASDHLRASTATDALVEGLEGQSALPREVRRPSVRISSLALVSSASARMVWPEVALKLMALEDQDSFDDYPKIMAGSDGRRYFGAGDQVRISALPSHMAGHRRFQIVRVGAVLRNPRADENLARSIGLVGVATIARPPSVSAEPARMMLISQALREVAAGDVLLPMEDARMDASSATSQLRHDLKPQVLLLQDGLTQAGPQQWLLIDKGTRDGLRAGIEFDLLRADAEDAAGASHARLRIISVSTKAASAVLLSAREPVLIGDVGRLASDGMVQP